MTHTDIRGSYQYPSISGGIPHSTQAEMDNAVKTLQANKDAWVKVTVQERMALIDELIHDFYSITSRLVEAEIEAKGLQGDDFASGSEWGSQLAVLRNLTSLRRALVDIARVGHPQIPGHVRVRPDGQVTAQVFPETGYDQLFYKGYTMEVWMESGVTSDDLSRTQAVAYQDKNHPGSVALVLGAGNVSALSFCDVLYKLFVEDQVALLKMNPVNAYAGPIIEDGFRALVKPGFLRLVYGGAAEGAYLCNHPGIGEVHITGSDKTFETIVFGPGDEGAQRKVERQPLLTKRITGELGNVTPVIIVPGS